MKIKLRFSFFAAVSAAAFFYPQAGYLFGCAALHELSHVLAMLLCGIMPKSLELSWLSAALECPPAGSAKTAVIAAAGPFGGLIGAIIGAALGNCELFYSAVSLSIFNLLPVAPLDGEKLLTALLGRIFSQRKLRVISFSAIAALFAAGVYSLSAARNPAVIIVATALFFFNIKK